MVVLPMSPNNCYLSPQSIQGGKVFVGSLQKPTFRFARLENQGGGVRPTR